MTEIQEPPKTKEYYRNMINKLGKKEFTLRKMIEFGFWPKDLPTPFERQKDEKLEDFVKREKLFKELDEIITKISKLYSEQDKLNKMLWNLSRNYSETYDIDEIRKIVAKQIMKESIERRAKRKKERELAKKQRLEAWKKKKKEEIVYIGKGYSSMIHKMDVNKSKLESFGLPVIKNSPELARFLSIEFKDLRFLAYHRDVITIDHYARYKIPKRNGKLRDIAAPMPLLKRVQRSILDEILYLIPVSESAHGFLNEKSVKTSAEEHKLKPKLLINMDIKDFFPTITFERVRGMFISFGYSGQIASILSMICTYCERMTIEIKGEKKHVAKSKRILPQGSPASPMITNIICRKLDSRLNGLAKKFGLSYTRYADDLSFSLNEDKNINISKFTGLIYKILEEEGFKINKGKNRFLKSNNRQEITGVVINEKMGVSKKWLKKFRAAIFNAKKMIEKDDLELEKINEINGMASWLRSINADRYKKILNEVNEIIKPKEGQKNIKIKKPKKKSGQEKEFSVKCLDSNKKMKHFQTDLEGNLKYICRSCKNSHQILILSKSKDKNLTCLACNSPMKQEKTLVSPKLLNFYCNNKKCMRFYKKIQIIIM